MLWRCLLSLNLINHFLLVSQLCSAASSLLSASVQLNRARAVLEKTLESPLDCKEIQPVHSEGDQSWVFFGGNDAEAETPILWPPHVKS